MLAAHVFSVPMIVLTQCPLHCDALSLLSPFPVSSENHVLDCDSVKVIDRN